MEELDAEAAGIEIVLTSDEEIGSFMSRALIEDCARRADAALVMEGSTGGTLKVGRKGTGMYKLPVHGRAIHAGLGLSGAPMRSLRWRTC